MKKMRLYFYHRLRLSEIQTYEEFSNLGDYRELIDGTMINLFYIQTVG